MKAVRERGERGVFEERMEEDGASENGRRWSFW